MSFPQNSEVSVIETINLDLAGNFPRISDDLVNSYHLLLCVLDLVYGNSLHCPNRKELLNPTFKGTLKDVFTMLLSVCFN